MPFALDNCPLAPDNITIEDAKFVYTPNFEGRAGMYNDEGERSFNVRVPDNIVEAVTKDGWNVKWTKPSKSATPQQIAEHIAEPYLEVAVGFKYRPANISVFEDGMETRLIVDEAAKIDTVKIIDTMQFKTMDMVLRGREWSSPNGCGIKAWLVTFVGVLEVDDIQRKYAAMRNAD